MTSPRRRWHDDDDGSNRLFSLRTPPISSTRASARGKLQGGRPPRARQHSFRERAQGPTASREIDSMGEVKMLVSPPVPLEKRAKRSVCQNGIVGN